MKEELRTKTFVNSQLHQGFLFLLSFSPTSGEIAVHFQDIFGWWNAAMCAQGIVASPLQDNPGSHDLRWILSTLFLLLL